MTTEIDTTGGATQEEVLPTQVSKTYEATAIEWLEALPEQLKEVPETLHLFIEGVASPIVREAVIRFAHHLDGFNTLDVQLELLALRQARKIDREFMTDMIDELGLEKAKEIARKVNGRHNMGFNKVLNKANETVDNA